MNALAIAALAAALAAAPPAEAPAWPLKQAEDALSDRVGEAFFRAHFTFLAEESRADPGMADCPACHELERHPHWLLLWALRSDEKPFVDERVLVKASWHGKVFEVSGVPTCRENPELCAISVDEAEAFRIARMDRLEAGLEPWKTSFHYHHGFERFVWMVSNLLERGEHGSEKGSGLVIDAVTGTTLGRFGWFATS